MNLTFSFRSPVVYIKFTVPFRNGEMKIIGERDFPFFFCLGEQTKTSLIFRSFKMQLCLYVFF